MLSSPLAVAVPHSTNEGESLPSISPPVLTPSPTDLFISFQAANTGNLAACMFSQLSPDEVQRLKDSVLTPGLIADEISSGEAPNTDRDRVSDRNTLLVPNPGDNESAFQKEIPTEILDPSELSPLQNNLIRGPVAFGLSLDDSLRAARCENEEGCAISGEKLQYRNSGEGISGNVKDIFHAVVGNMESTDSVFSQEESDYLQAQITTEQVLETEDANKLEVEVFSREKNPILMNHVRVDNTLDAGLLTNCDNGSCIITVYSMFDKYFNAWFSGELVIGTFAPTAWGQFRKMLVNSKRYNVLSTKITEKLNLPDMWRRSRIKSFTKDPYTFDPKYNYDVPMAPSEFFTKYGGSGAEIEGKTLLDNYKKSLLRDQDASNTVNELFGQKKFVSLGSTSQIADASFGVNGAFTNIKDLETRQKLFSFWGKVKQHADVADVLRDKAIKEQPNLVERARAIAVINKDFDDAWKLDLVEVSRIDGAPSWSDFTFLNNNNQPINWVHGEDKYYKDAYEQFYHSGKFSLKVPASAKADLQYATPITRPDGTVAEGFQMFKYKVENVGGPVDALKLANGEYSDQLLQLSTGQVMPAIPSVLKDQQYLNDIKFGITPRFVTKGGPAPVVPPQVNGVIDWSKLKRADGTWDDEKLGIMTPELFANRMMAGDIIQGKIKNAKRNADYIYETMISRDWGKGKYTNILSKQLQTQDNLVKNYFNVVNPNVAASGIGWTAKMYGYWWLTRGFGSDKFSIYQLPEEWTEVRFDAGQSDLYDDAYVDFFAHEGSDTGDIFQRVISNFPVPIVLGEFAQQYEPLENAWNAINAHTGRTAPDNLAMFLFGADSCPGCSTSIYSPTDGRFDVQYISPESTNSFFLEHGKSEEAKEDGQLLMLFAHHMNVNGQLKGEKLDPIDLVNARNNEETCEQVSESIFLYGHAAKLFGAETTGAAIALTENIAYMSLGLMGTFVTLANQLAVAPKLNECVDDKEGYYASVFVPIPDGEEKTGKADEIQKSVTENALDGIRSFTNQIDQEHESPSLPDKILQEATGKVRELVDDAQDVGVAEAELRITGSSSGYFKSEEVMYFWVGGDGLIQPSKYNTDGSTLLTAQDGHTILLDNDNGTITVDGQSVITDESADHTRLANKNLSIPAVEIPQRLNGFSLSDTNEWLLSVNIRGEAVIQDADLLDCIQAAVFAQSGVGLNSNNMSEAFGLTESIVTDAYPNIAIDPLKNRIVLGGRIPQIASGPGARVDVYANRNVLVSNASNPDAGKFQSALFENGSVIYKPETNELLIWLRHHANAVVSDKDVQNFSGNLTTTKNSLTSCDEPAVDLSVETDPATPATKLKGDNLTAGLEKNGPFQVFETDSKRFILYSKLVDGECKDFFKVVNKETGEVYDQEITDISQNEDGTISIKTADGQTHSLKFSDENGKPVLTYDGQSELLRSAIGKGGSFYYDPNKGLYFAENAQLIPLNDNFKNQGVSFQANPDGTASGKAGDNVFNINTGQPSEGIFNIPSIPETVAGALLFVLVLGLLGAGIYLDQRNRKAKTALLN